MKKVILEEIENMKYLFGYKPGVVISEQQQTTYGNEYITGADPVNTAQIPSLGGIQPSNQSTADMLKNAQAVAAGITTTNNQSQQATGTQATTAPVTGTQATTAPVTGTQATTAPVTPIKTGVSYPSIVELQNLLKTKFQADLTPDGKYGPKTAESVLAALQKLPVNSTETKTTSNTTDQNAETLKKTAEANASTNVVKTNDQNKNTQQPAGGTNVPEVDSNEFE